MNVQVANGIHACCETRGQIPRGYIQWFRGYIVKCKGPWGLDRHQLGGVAAA